MVSFKSRCIALRKKGFTLNQIVKIMRRSKTSVYFHIKKISLNARRKQEIRLASIKRVVEYSRSIKGKSRLNRHPIKFLSWNYDLVNLVAHLIFDGEIKHMGCVYTNRSMVLHNQVISSIKNIYKFPPKKYESMPGVFRTSYFNVELSSYLKNKSNDLMKNLPKMNRELQLAFLRAFFDDEGSVYFIGVRRAIRGFQHSYEKLLIIKNLLKNFGIESKIDKKYNEIIISRKENIEKFARKINFTPGVRVNGKRSNSVWKKSLEKREILKKALASYQN